MSKTQFVQHNYAINIKMWPEDIATHAGYKTKDMHTAHDKSELNIQAL